MTEKTEARFYKTLQNQKVQCFLCPHNCIIPDGKRGICNVREAENGKLYTLVYGFPVASGLDPIEKKPLFHFYPGAPTFSYSTVGCNLKCVFCQNYSISQASPSDFAVDYVSPQQMVQIAQRYGCKIIAHTYTEPTVYFEYAFDIAKLANSVGIKNVFVSNGFMSEEAARAIAPYLQAINIDLKAFRDETYKKFCKGRLQPVLDTIKLLHSLGVWVEVTTLVIPNLNDSPQELRDIARFIASVSKSIPWHVSRFHPDYKMLDRGPTPVSSLLSAMEIGKEEGLEYVYVGNVPGHDGESTYCPKCKELLISRFGFSVQFNRIKDGACPSCGYKIAGVWE